MSINVPRDLFRGPDAELITEKALPFRRMMRARYPWLSESAMDVVLNHARQEMVRVMDEESGGRMESARLAKNGDLAGAIRHLQEHLAEDPEDADAWYSLGELLCRTGRTDEGYQAFAKGRRSF
jgi:predicted Zn-dependent protease